MKTSQIERLFYHTEEAEGNDGKNRQHGTDNNKTGRENV